MTAKKVNSKGLTVQEQIAIREKNARYNRAARERRKEQKLKAEAEARAQEVEKLLTGELASESLKDLKPLIDKNLKYFLESGSQTEKLQLTKEALKYIYGDKETEEKQFNVIFRIEKDTAPINQELQGEGEEEKRKKPIIEAEGLPEFFKNRRTINADSRRDIKLIVQNADEIAKQVSNQLIDDNLTDIEAPTSAEQLKSRILATLPDSDIPEPSKAIFDDEFLQKVHASRNKRQQIELKLLRKEVAKLKEQLKQQQKGE